MLINRLAFSGIVVALLSTSAMGQQDQTSAFDVVTEEEAVEVGHSHGAEAMQRHEGPVAVRTAPQEASATLENVTWELLSRMAAQLFSGNRAALLSGNEPEVLSENHTNVASGNQLQILAGNKVSLFSNIQIDIHITGLPNPAEMMGGRSEIRVETRNLPQIEPRELCGVPSETPREQPRIEFREVPEIDSDSESLREE